MSEESPFDRVAHLALDGYSPGATFQLSTLIGEQLFQKGRRGQVSAPLTALNYVRNVLKFEAAAAFVELIDIPPHETALIAAAQGRVRGFIAVEDKLREVLAAGDEMWKAFEEEDREAIIDFMGLDADDPDLSKGFDHG